MTLEITIKTLIILLIVIIIITEHILNWWFRNIDEDSHAGENIAFILIYLLRLTLIVGSVYSLIPSIPINHN